MKFKLSVLAIVAIFASSAFAQAPATKNVSDAVTPISPGFLPPGLNDLRRQPDTKPAPAAKASVQEEAPQKEEGGKPKFKTREEIAAAENRKFKPTGKKVVVSEASAIPQEFFADPVKQQMGGMTATPIGKLESVVNVKPGETASVPIAIGALNRIVTPFVDAVVDTVAEIQVKKAGGVVMIATGSMEPASVIIREKEAPESAFMLNLVPQSGIPARDVRINASFAKRANASRDDDTPEKDSAHPLAIKLKNLMRDLAKGKIPSGYAMEKGSGIPAKCDLPGFETREAQIFNGSTMTIRVYAAKNLTDGPNELDERGCSSRRQLAAGAWPRMSLGKGEKTELFVIEAPIRESGETASRPSAIE